MNIILLIIAWWAAVLIVLALFGLSGAIAWLVFEEVRVWRLHRAWRIRDGRK